MGGGGGGKGGGSAETETTSNSAPWGEQIPYLIGGTNSNGDTVKGVFPEAARLYDSGGLAGDYYNGSTVAPESDYTTQARQMVANRAANGSGIINTATDSTSNILNGNAQANNTGLNALNSFTEDDNPYISDLYNKAAGNAVATVNSNFSKAGRYGSGAQAAAVSDTASNLANQMYSNAYNQKLNAAGQSANAYNHGVNTQLAAATTGQSLGNQAYTDAAQLANAGASLDDYNQSVTDADVDRWNYNQQKDLIALQNYLNLVGGTYGGQSTSNSESSGGSSGGLFGGK